MVDRKQSPPLGLVLGLLASLAVVLAGLFMVRWLAPASWLHANNEVAGNYLQTLGTIYAVLLAFVVFVVWQQHNDTRGAVAAEANELSDLDRLMQAFPEAVRARVSACTCAYRQAVVEEEWTALAQGRTSHRAEQTLEGIWRALEVIEPRARREEVLYAEALARFNDLSDARTHRLHCSRLRLPSGLWVLLLTNGGLVIGSMWLFGLESFWAHALMTLALAGSIAFILYLIADLDNPFWGSWQVSAEPFLRALDRKMPPDVQGNDGPVCPPPDRV
jgi:hypothetical protein